MGVCVGCVGFKNIYSSSEFLALYKARLFFGVSPIPLTCCFLLSMGGKYMFILVHIHILFITGLDSILLLFEALWSWCPHTNLDYEYSTVPFLISLWPRHMSVLSWCNKYSCFINFKIFFDIPRGCRREFILRCKTKNHTFVCLGFILVMLLLMNI